MTDTLTPTVSLLKSLPTAEFKDLAAQSLPSLQQDGLRLVALVTERKDGQIAAILQYKDFTGAVRYERSATGSWGVGGQIEWRF